ncbi:MAG TPA: bifunctional 2-polyprenyl-6-hydroxyphenol methylase/3-demethylubiquinol 3-O-methyltransferase UbiG [Chlamydiales bacterium]|nr:bifunctional 2-polyprenyl-6-hydroxyphenol methylase/3-demethylubiquinol 3-O-methyltransferase UbiG [Chlamydiales bacterium]
MERSPRQKDVINNDFYEMLQDGWYTASNHPVGLLRAENAVRNPWIANEIKKRVGKGALVLDIGCGAGLLTNYLALNGCDVSGIDISANSLEIARQYDATKKVRYVVANAYELPFHDESFDVVCAMDVLEHVEKPEQLIHEAARVLKPGGLFFFHTFNRNFLSYLVAIKGIEWFVKNAPKNMHVYDLFIKPKELRAMMQKELLEVTFLTGLVPCFWKSSFWKMLFTGIVPDNFRFTFMNNTMTGYCGIAKKQE